MGNCGSKSKAPQSVNEEANKKSAVKGRAPQDVTLASFNPVSISARENQIKLHAQAKQSKDHDGEGTLQHLTLGDDEKGVEKEQYRRIKNVFAAPLEIIADYVPPVFEKNEEDTKFLTRGLRDNFIFSGMDSDERSKLIEAMEPVTEKKGNILIKQGDIGDYFYVLKEGQVSILVDGVVVGTSGKGESFGELALLYDSPRSATVKADKDCRCFRVDQTTFRSLLANTKAAASKENINILRKIDFLSGLDDNILTKVSDALSTIPFRDGDVIVHKGDKGEVFYIIKEGKVKVSDIGLGESEFQDQTLSSGEFFGERALITGEKRAATVRAAGDCVLWCLSREQFETLLGKVEDLITLATAKRILMGIPIVIDAKLEPFELNDLVNSIETVSFKKGDVLSEAGTQIGCNPKYPQGVYFITHDIAGGQISLVNSKGQVNLLKVGDYFGVRDIKAKKGDLTDLNIIVNADTSCKHISLRSIERVLGSAERLGQASGLATKLDKSITMDVLKKKKILGSGTFGQVWLVSHVNSNKAYALKIQNKRELIKFGQADGVVREKNLMSSIDHPFIIRLENSFQNKSNLFMVMNLVQGGELFSVLHTEKSDGVPESSAKFYAGCILEGLSYMHNRHMLYRDLKPENVLIDKDGYCVLIDLGFAKTVMDKTYTLCGTPLYLAPEIILSRGYDKSVDYWSLGVLIFEMLLGYSPFYKDNIDQMTLFKRIVKVQYSFPAWCEASDASQDLVKKILVLKPTDRLGSLAGADADIREHLWLSSVPAEGLLSKSINAPWVPKIKNPFDVSNFDNWDHLEDKERVKGRSLTVKEQTVFEDF